MPFGSQNVISGQDLKRRSPPLTRSNLESEPRQSFDLHLGQIDTPQQQPNRAERSTTTGCLKVNCCGFLLFLDFRWWQAAVPILITYLQKECLLLLLFNSMYILVTFYCCNFTRRLSAKCGFSNEIYFVCCASASLAAF